MKRRIQMVFQDPYSSLNPSQTILQAFDEPMQIHGIGKRGPSGSSGSLSCWRRFSSLQTI